jgi:hypothetical protein
MEGISIQGRSTQGVSIITPGPGDAVASIAVIEMAQPLGGGTEAAGPDAGPDAGPPPEQLSLPGQEKSGANGKSPKSSRSNGAGKSPVAAKTTSARSKAALKKAEGAIRRASATNKSVRPAARKPAGKPKPARRR